jgi:hypothetical protein
METLFFIWLSWVIAAWIMIGVGWLVSRKK